MKKSESELFFVEVKEPEQVKRAILESLREILEIMRKFEKFRQTRHHKLERINHLRVLVRQASRMMGSLRLKLPQTNLRATVVREQAPHKKAHHKKGRKEAEGKPQPKKPMTELEKLESELNAIEGKLKNLS